MQGVNKLFHEAIKRNIAWVAIAGFNKGIAILLKVWSSPEPSFLAASTISTGREAFINCLIKKIADGTATAGIINGR